MLCQQYIIPFRAAYALVDLAHADLYSYHLADCQIKIEGLDNILGPLDNQPKPKKAFIKEPKQVEQAFDEMVSDFGEIMLEVPVPTRKYQNTLGSPVLSFRPFTLPSFLFHDGECKCLRCINIEYKELMFEKLLLEFKLTIYQNNGKGADEFMQKAKQFYELIQNNYETYNKNTLSIVEKDIMPEPNYYLCKVYSAIQLFYCHHLYMINNSNDAISTLSHLKKLYNSSDYKNQYIQDEIYELDFSLKFDLIYKVKTLNILPSPEPASNSSVKTPVNKLSKVTIQPHSPISIPTCSRKVPKVISFDLFSEDEDNEKTKKVTRQVGKKLVSKTPSKIKIYENSPDDGKAKRLKSTKTRRAVDTAKKPEKTIEDKGVRLVKPKGTQSKVLGSSSTNGINKASCGDALNINTKLLTEKLKNSLKPAPTILITQDSQEDIFSSGAAPAKSYSKKKVNSLSSQENKAPVEASTVRKSGRNRK